MNALVKWFFNFTIQSQSFDFLKLHKFGIFEPTLNQWNCCSIKPLINLRMICDRYIKFCHDTIETESSFTFPEFTLNRIPNSVIFQCLLLFFFTNIYWRSSSRRPTDSNAFFMTPSSVFTFYDKFDLHERTLDTIL